MRYLALTAAALIALALPAGAQTIAATSVTRASSAALFSSEKFRPAPNLREARVLATAAFERPPAPFHIADRRDAVFEAPPPKAKEEWSPNQRLYLDGTRLAYRTSF